MTLRTVHNLADLRATVGRWRRDGERVAFVPTMGNLHAGHFRLVARARELGRRVVVSIFVNPLQFGPGEDYQTYPRTLDADTRGLAERDTDLVFAPDVDTMYPGGTGVTTRVTVPELSDILCGASRPGHFDGVTTVVNRLFNMVQPDVAVFGEKDYQQLQIIRRMVRDLAMPVSVEGVATEREADGLALSSRNQYLTAAERAVAPCLYQALSEAVAQIRDGRRDFAALQAESMAGLRSAGFQPDYFEVRDANSLSLPAPESRLVVLAAARLGRARLIDNLRVDGA
ncbi:MAG: pantoate--beta-alanine ligase [Gammaproteobacteria bacterium]|jgi:pantoate--beta-alanine ligase